MANVNMIIITSVWITGERKSMTGSNVFTLKH